MSKRGPHVNSPGRHRIQGIVDSVVDEWESVTGGGREKVGEESILSHLQRQRETTPTSCQHLTRLESEVVMWDVFQVKRYILQKG